LRDADAEALERARAGWRTWSTAVPGTSLANRAHVARGGRRARLQLADRWSIDVCQSFLAARRLRSELSELDAVVDIAANIGVAGGVFGCRMTGGGFGGCTVALVEARHVTAISDRVATEYQRRTQIKPTLFVSRPAAGATLL